MALPHEQDWELKPENGHPNAQALLLEPYYWDCLDALSTLGNDTLEELRSSCDDMHPHWGMVIAKQQRFNDLANKLSAIQTTPS